MESQISITVWLECFCDHDRAPKGRLAVKSSVDATRTGRSQHVQIRSSNTNIDDSLNLLPGITRPLTTPNLLGELLHMLQDAVDFFHHALSINLHWLVCDIAQSNVVDRSILGEIDGFSIEHRIAKLFDTDRKSVV